MGNILRKVVREKMKKEKNDHYWKLYRMYAHQPPHMQSYEFIKLQSERREKGYKNLSNFLKHLLNKNQDDTNN